MTDIFKEAKHELQQEKLHLAIKKYYKGAIALIVLILLSTSVYVYIRESNIRESEKMSEEYYNLFLSEKKLNTIKESDFGKLIDFQKSIYSKFAKMKYVELLIKDKKNERAIQLLFHLIEDSKSQLEIRNLAKIKVTELVMKNQLKSYNEKVLDTLQKATNKGNTVPYFYMLKLLLGQLLIQDNNQEKAFEVLKDLSTDENTPENIKFFSNITLGNYLQ